MLRRGECTVTMAWIWTAMTAAALVFGVLSGRSAEVSAAAMEGAASAVQLCLRIGGMICLWSGVMELMRRCALSEKLSAALLPLLRRLFPLASRDEQTREALAENLSSNLLGLGNAATPAGIRAARGMQRLTGNKGMSAEMGRLVVLNTASVQLLPTTIAAVRAAAGASSALDILPAVWLSSVVSVCVGLGAEYLLRRRAAR